MAQTFGITKVEYQKLLNRYKNKSLKRKVEMLKESKEIDIKYGFTKSHSQKRKMRKADVNRFRTFTI